MVPISRQEVFSRFPRFTCVLHSIMYALLENLHHQDFWDSWIFFPKWISFETSFLKKNWKKLELFLWNFQWSRWLVQITFTSRISDRTYLTISNEMDCSSIVSSQIKWMIISIDPLPNEWITSAADFHFISRAVIVFLFQAGSVPLMKEGSLLSSLFVKYNSHHFAFIILLNL